MAFEVRGGSVALEIPLPAALIAALTSVAESVLSFSQSTGFSPLTTLMAVVGAAVFLRLSLARGVPKLEIPTEDDAEALDALTGRKKLDPRTASPRDAGPGKIQCWDPCTMDDLGVMKAFTPAEVTAAIGKARQAQKTWQDSSFADRAHLMRVIRRTILENMETIARVACRDSGKTRSDALLGELMVTMEKCKWLASSGAKCLQPEYRASGTLNMMKTSRVEYTPVGVVGAIVPWNYPFHNVFNPLTAALFSGNAIVIKVSENASWSTKYYSRMIRAILASVGAPLDLVQIVTGYGEAGHELTQGGIDTLIFVGSVSVGRKVQEACGSSLTPVILELGGKDPFIICEDANLASVEQVAMRGVFGNMGQNCAGPERFLVYESVYEAFIERVGKVVRGMKQGPTLSDANIDCGAVRLNSQIAALQRLVDDATSKGARLVAGGFTPKPGSRLAQGQFYPPTVLADVTEDMAIWKEEIFGPILCITKVPFNSDREAVRLANASDFALGSCCFTAQRARGNRIVRQLHAGMGAVNDLEGTSYLSQSLPFGGSKNTGFGRFAGPEGLRGLSHVKAIVQDRFTIGGGTLIPYPPEVHYPSKGADVPFWLALQRMLYGYGLSGKAYGLVQLLKVIANPPFWKGPVQPTLADDTKESAAK
mmetsp:Transcript_5084/g.12219  ORF Transcript_5084/g.12219 Transcript_5084/m.12219 type:complete len:651 (-) Transcript_5084:5-1957(-)